MAGGPFADRAPHMVEHETHGHLFIIDDLKPFPIGLAGAAGKPSDDLRASGDTAETLARRRLGSRRAARRHGHRRCRRRSAVSVDRHDPRAVEGPRLPDRLHPRVQRLARGVLCRGQGSARGLGDDPHHRSRRRRRGDRARLGRGTAGGDGAGRAARRPLRRAALRPDVGCVRRRGLAGLVPHPHRCRAAAIPRSVRGSGCSRS